MSETSWFARGDQFQLVVDAGAVLHQNRRAIILTGPQKLRVSVGTFFHAFPGKQRVISGSDAVDNELPVLVGVETAQGEQRNYVGHSVELRWHDHRFTIEHPDLAEDLLTLTMGYRAMRKSPLVEVLPHRIQLLTIAHEFTLKSLSGISER